MLTLTTEKQIEEIKDQNRYALLLIGKKDCPPCKELKEYLLSIECEYVDVQFFTIEGTLIKDWCFTNDITTVPVLFIYDNSCNIIYKQKGFNPSDKQTIINILDLLNKG